MNRKLKNRGLQSYTTSKNHRPAFNRCSQKRIPWPYKLQWVILFTLELDKMIPETCLGMSIRKATKRKCVFLLFGKFEKFCCSQKYTFSYKSYAYLLGNQASCIRCDVKAHGSYFSCSFALSLNCRGHLCIALLKKSPMGSINVSGPVKHKS